VSLRAVLPEWLAREPDNSCLAVFAPLLIEDDGQLRTRAPRLRQTVQADAVSAKVREVRCQVLEFWLFERRRAHTAKELLRVNGSTPPTPRPPAPEARRADFADLGSPARFDGCPGYW
jgi:hypothetical protein